MKNIRLQGKLGDRFIESIDLDVSSAMDAVSALSANFPEMQKYLAEKERKGVRYGIKSRKTGKFLNEQEIEMRMEGGFDVCPSPAGGMSMGMMASLAMSAVTTLASGYINKKIAEGMKQDDEVLTLETNSYIFRGKENRQEQGTTIPLGYGRMLVGSNVISHAINNYDLDPENGSIYSLAVGAYTLLPTYHPSYDSDYGPLISSAIKEVAEGSSEMGIMNPDYGAIKDLLKKGGKGTKFGSNDGIYGNTVETDGDKYAQKIGGGFFGSLSYEVIYNKSVAEAFLTNFQRGGNFVPGLRTYGGGDFGDHGWDRGIGTKIPEDLVFRTKFAIVQSRPRSETISGEQREFYPILFSNGSILKKGEDGKIESPTLGTPVTVGSRYKKRKKESGIGWHKFESVSISKSIDLVCEGPIKGFCDQNGNHLEFSDAKTSQSSTVDNSGDDYLRGVFLNDYPIKEVKRISSTERQAVYNVNEFDIDVGRNEEGEIGTNDQKLLEKKYQFISETKQVGGKLFGPNLIDAARAAAASGSGIKEWNQAAPYYDKNSFITNGSEGNEKKYLSLRSTNEPFNPLNNYIRQANDIQNIVVKNPKFTQKDGKNTTQIETSSGFYQSTDSFIPSIVMEGGNSYESIGMFIDDSSYPEGLVVYERPIYGGSRPLEDDDEDGIFNYQDPDQMITKNSYWRTGPNAKKLKKWKTGNGYEVGDLVYGNYNFVYKVTMAIPSWDASSLTLGDASAIKSSAGNAKLFVLSDLPQEDGTIRFQSMSSESSGGFLAAASKLDPTSFIKEDISLNNSEYWSEVFPTKEPDIWVDSANNPLIFDPTGNAEDNSDTRDAAKVLVNISEGGSGLNVKPEEEYPLTHIITNRLVDQALVTLQIDALSYLYPGDEVEVTYRVGPLMMALMGAIIGVGSTADMIAETDDVPPDVAKYAAAAFWGSMIGLVIGVILAEVAEFKIGTKIENSGETWPNKIRFRIKYGNEGEPLQETDVVFFGVCTSSYARDIKLYLPPNPNGRTRIIKAYKISRERDLVKEGEQAMRYKEEASFASVTEISTVKCSYPNSVVIGTRVNAKDMPNMPKRNYNLLLKKVKVPINYDAESKTYGEMWDGRFSPELQWTDNPAWCLYDLISNNSYGLGKYGMDVDFIDKWTFYRAAKYCDELIPTGYSPTYSKKTFYTNGSDVLNIDGQYESDNDFFLEFDHPGKKVAIFYELLNGEKKYLSNTIKSVETSSRGKLRRYKIRLEKSIGFGIEEGQVCAEIYYPILENRYRFNALLTSPQNAFKMINEIAAMFRAYTYWGAGKINFYLDEPKEPLLLFGNNNVTEEGFSYSSTPRHQRTNAIKIKYLDESNAFKPKIEYVEDRDKIIDNGLYENSLNSLGTTTRTQAHRIAEYNVQGKNLETELITFKTSMPGSYLRPGDIIDVLDNKKTVGRFAGKILNFNVSGDGKVAYLDIDWPVRTLIDESDDKTFKKIKLYNISGYDTLETLNLKSDPNQDGSFEGGQAITDEEIKSIRAGQIDEYMVGSITNNDTRIEIINNPYSFVSGNFNWLEALMDAKIKGGELATINNDVDQRFVQNVLPKDNLARAWLGGYWKESPPPEEFIWVDPQGCIDDDKEVIFSSWTEGFPIIPSGIAEDSEAVMQTDSPSYNNPLVLKELDIAADHLDMPQGHGYIAVSGSNDLRDHADWYTADKNIRQGYILEKRADDKLLKLDGIDGLSFLLEDEVNIAQPKQYRVLNIKEEGNHTYTIEGIEYSYGKFDVIENNETLPVPRSPIIHTQKYISPPTILSFEYLDESIENSEPYGLRVEWAHPDEDTIRAYRLQIFEGTELKKTKELKKQGKFSQFFVYRDSFIKEGGDYRVKLEALQ